MVASAFFRFCQSSRVVIHSSSSRQPSAIFSSCNSCCWSLYCCRTDARVDAAFAMSACAAVSSSLISSRSLRYFFLFAASTLPWRCAVISQVKSVWHLASINLAIDKTRDIWNTNRNHDVHDREQTSFSSGGDHIVCTVPYTVRPPSPYGW